MTPTITITSAFKVQIYNLENEKGYMIFVRGDRMATLINSPETPTVLRTIGKLYMRAYFLPPQSYIPAQKFQL